MLHLGHKWDRFWNFCWESGREGGRISVSKMYGINVMLWYHSLHSNRWLHSLVFLSEDFLASIVTFSLAIREGGREERLWYPKCMLLMLCFGITALHSNRWLHSLFHRSKYFHASILTFLLSMLILCQYWFSIPHFLYQKYKGCYIFYI